MATHFSVITGQSTGPILSPASQAVAEANADALPTCHCNGFAIRLAGYAMWLQDVREGLGNPAHTIGDEGCAYEMEFDRWTPSA